MPTTSTDDLIRGVLLLVDESRDSPIAALPAGDGSGDSISPEDGAIRFLNEAREWLFKRVLAVGGVFSAPLAIGVYTAPYAAFAPLAGDPMIGPADSQIWWARRLDFKAGAGTYGYLTPTTEEVIALHDRNYQTALGNPSNWYRVGTHGVAVWKAPSAAGVVKAEGFILPAPVTAGGSVDWIPVGQTRLLLIEAAIRLLKKVANHDENAGPRLGLLIGERDDLVIAQYLSLPEALRKRGAAFPVPPVALPAAGNGRG